MKIENQSDDSISIESIASGQKFFIYAILLSFVFHILKGELDNVAWLAGIAAFVLALLGIFRLVSGFNCSNRIKILLVVAMLVPYVNIVLLLMLNSRANKALRAAGYKVGLFGATLSAKSH